MNKMAQKLFNRYNIKSLQQKQDIMKTLFVSILTILMTLSFNLSAQQLSKKELRAQKRLAQEQKTDSLVNGGSYTFTADKAHPQGFRTIDLTTNPNHLKVTPEQVNASLPFFGRGYAGMAYGGDAGIKFENKPTKYTLTKTKKGYLVVMEVSGKSETFNLTLDIFKNGTATLTVLGTNRSAMSYTGTIEMNQ